LFEAVPSCGLAASFVGADRALRPTDNPAIDNSSDMPAMG
jgi:hypothetical protein